MTYWKLRNRFLPGIMNCQQVYEHFLMGYLDERTIWLDLGCGHTLLHQGGEDKSSELVHKTKLVVGVDLDLNALFMNRILQHRVGGDLESLPFRDGSFSLVTCNMVIEHAVNPECLVKEIERILRPEGVAIIHTPNLFHWEVLLSYLTPHKLHEIFCWFLDARSSNDVYRVFYRANTSSRLNDLFRLVAMTRHRGGPVTNAPRRFPIPFLSGLLTLASIVEVKFLSHQFFSPLRHNLLLSFRKSASSLPKMVLDGKGYADCKMVHEEQAP